MAEEKGHRLKPSDAFRDTRKTVGNLQGALHRSRSPNAISGWPTHGWRSPKKRTGLMVKAP